MSKQHNVTNVECFVYCEFQLSDHKYCQILNKDLNAVPLQWQFSLPYRTNSDLISCGKEHI